jgi:antirestriction protein ArdC
MDEVVCELTSSFVLADLGIAHRPRPEHAAYITSWLKALKDDPRAIFTAAGKAQQAADWMHAQQPAHVHHRQSARRTWRAAAGAEMLPHMLHQKARRRVKGRRGVQSDLGARQ